MEQAGAGMHQETRQALCQNIDCYPLVITSAALSITCHVVPWVLGHCLHATGTSCLINSLLSTAVIKLLMGMLLKCIGSAQGGVLLVSCVPLAICTHGCRQLYIKTE